MAIPRKQFLKELEEIEETTAKTADLSTPEGLASYASDLGYEEEVKKILGGKQKLSTLQRISKGLGILNPAEAILTGREKGIGAGIGKYFSGAAKGLASAITGTDYEGERRYFKDVAAEMGIENGIAKTGIGFLGDVLLDPSTYFGGAIAKALTKGAGAVSRTGLGAVGKISPGMKTGIEMTLQGAQDAFGSAFIAAYKATKGAKEDVLSHLSSLNKELLDRAGIQMGKLGVQGLTTEQLREVGLKGALGKRAEYLLGEEITEGGRIEATKLIQEAQQTGDWSKLEKINPELAKQVNVKFDNPLQQEYWKKQQASILEYAKRGGVEDPYSVYYPFLKKQAREKFLMDMKKSGIQVGSADWNKQFRNILATENIELDPRIAFFTRESQIIASTRNREFLKNFVEKYGKPIDSFADESIAKQAGYGLLRESGGFGKAVGYLPLWDKKLLDDLIRPEFQSLNMLAKATGFDALTSLFKRSVTGPFLPFHIRNWVSGIIQNYEVLGWRALLPWNMANGFKMAKWAGEGKMPNGIIKLAGRDYNWRDIFKPFDTRFAGDTFYTNDYLEHVESGATQLLSKTGMLSKERLAETVKHPISPESIIFKPWQVLGTFIEHQQKAVAYLTALDMGKTIPEALQLAERAGFDYKALTKFESQIIRRIIPFYSYCVPDDSLILTKIGWKTCDELQKGEIVLTYSMEKDCYEWQEAQDIHIFDYNASLMKLSNDRNSILFTPEHRWVVETLPQTVKHSYGEYKYNGIKKIKRGYELNTQDRIKVVSEFIENKNSVISVEDAELLGWLLTDGYWRWKGNYCEAVIYQSPKKSTYQEALRVAGEQPRSFHPQTGVALIPVNKQKKERIQHLLKRSKVSNNWADIVCGLSREAMESMYNAMYLADGTVGKRTCDSFASQLDGVATTFEILATLLGKRVKRNERGYYVSDKTHIKIAGMKKELIDFEGRVWCPKTKNETWVMKQNGFITITGNTRKNIELQLKTLGENPQRINQIIRAIENIGEPASKEERENLPDFMREGFAVKLGDKPGSVREYLSSFGTPIEQFAQLFKPNMVLSAISTMNPLLKTPLELGTGKDSFRQKDLKDVYDAKEYALAPKIVKDWLDIKEVKKPTYDKVGNNLVKTGEKTVYVADPEKLLIARSLFTSRGVNYLDSLFNGDVKGFMKIMKLFSGIKPYEIDIEISKAMKDKETKRALEDLLIKMGEYRRYESIYKPKY